MTEERKCAKGIPWEAHKVNAVGNWVYFEVSGAIVCGHDARVTSEEGGTGP